MEEFNAKEAWNLIGAKGARSFKTSESTGEEIADPAMRMTHFILASNLLGHINTTVTMIELYFMWCMIKKVKVHLGYWLAHSFHKIAHHPVHHLYACHLLGAYLIKNVMPRLTIPTSSVEMCEDPEWFDISYLINIGVVERKGDVVVFCKHEQSEGESEEEASEEDNEPEEAAEVKTPSERPSPTRTKPETPKVQPQSTEKESEGTEEKWQRIIEFMMQKFSEANEKKQAFLELQNEYMTQALSLIKRMTNLAEQNNQLALQLLSAASTSKGSQPQETTPETTSTSTLRRRKITTTGKPPSDLPNSSTTKRTKLDKQSGSHGSQKKD